MASQERRDRFLKMMSDPKGIFSSDQLVGAKVTYLQPQFRLVGCLATNRILDKYNIAIPLG